MNDERLESAVRTTLERQARYAPSSQQLLHDVLSRRAKRDQRRRAIGAGIAAVATIGVIVGSSLLPLGDGTGGPESGTEDLVSAGADPGILSEEEIEICLLGADDDIHDIVLTTRSGSDTERNVDSTVRTIDDQQNQIYQADDGRTAVRLELGPGPLAEFESDRLIDIGGRRGSIVDRSSGAARVLRVETGLHQLVLTIIAKGALPDQTRMIEWAEKISISEGEEACR